MKNITNFFCVLLVIFLAPTIANAKQTIGLLSVIPESILLSVNKEGSWDRLTRKIRHGGSIGDKYWQVEKVVLDSISYAIEQNGKYNLKFISSQNELAIQVVLLSQPRYSMGIRMSTTTREMIEAAALLGETEKVDYVLIFIPGSMAIPTSSKYTVNVSGTGVIYKETEIIGFLAARQILVSVKDRGPIDEKYIELRHYYEDFKRPLSQSESDAIVKQINNESYLENEKKERLELLVMDRIMTVKEREKLLELTADEDTEEANFVIEEIFNRPHHRLMDYPGLPDTDKKYMWDEMKSTIEREMTKKTSDILEFSTSEDYSYDTEEDEF